MRQTCFALRVDNFIFEDEVTSELSCHYLFASSQDLGLKMNHQLATTQNHSCHVSLKGKCNSVLLRKDIIHV